MINIWFFSFILFPFPCFSQYLLEDSMIATPVSRKKSNTKPLQMTPNNNTYMVMFLLHFSFCIYRYWKSWIGFQSPRLELKEQCFHLNTVWINQPRRFGRFRIGESFEKTSPSIFNLISTIMAIKWPPARLLSINI